MRNYESKLNKFPQNLYIGMDTHLKDWTVSIYSDEFELRQLHNHHNQWFWQTFCTRIILASLIIVYTKPVFVVFGSRGPWKAWA